MIIVVQGIAAIFAMLAAWAWMKSAILQVRPLQKDWLDRISRSPPVWNAIAAVLAAGAAVAQGVGYLLIAPPFSK
jgi:hypothetical protein